MEHKEEGLVVKSNNLIEAFVNMTKNEYKLTLYLISKINKNDTNFRKQTITVREFCKLLNISENGRSAYIKAFENSLLNNKIKILYENSDRLTINWYSYIKYISGSGVLEIMFNKELEECLLNIKSNFTKYKLKTILKFKSIYSMRLYELLKQYEFLKQRTIELKELRLKLGLENKIYPYYANFKKRIIITAQEEINSKSDITFEFEENKRNKKVNSITFYIKSGNINGIDAIADISFSQFSTELTDDHQIDILLNRVKNVVDNSISRRTIENLVKEYGTECINYYLNNWNKFSNVSMKSKAGFFITCIKQNYIPSEHQNVKPVQSTNYEQRQYEDEDLDIYYWNYEHND